MALPQRPPFRPAPFLGQITFDGGFQEISIKAGDSADAKSSELAPKVSADSIAERRSAAEEKMENASTDEDRTAAEAALAVVAAMADALDQAA